MLQDCRAELAKGTPIFAVKGASVTGKSALFGKLAIDLKKEGKTVVPLFCATTDRITTAHDVMIFLIDYIKEHLHLPPRKQIMEEGDLISKQQDPEGLKKTSEKQCLEQELTFNMESGPRLQDEFRTLVLLYSREATNNTIILVDAIDQLEEDGLLRFQR